MHKTFAALILVVTAQCWAQKTTCDVPPALWCDTPELTQLCNAQDLCTAYNTTVYNQKVKLTLFYEALCPDCQQFILNTLGPKINAELKSIITLELVPYGNAREKNVNGSWQYECQHGEQECLLNRVHGCAIQTLTDWFGFIFCMEDASSKGAGPQKAIDSCFEKQAVEKVDQRRIIDCYKNPATDQKLTHEMAQRTQAAWPTQHTFVPWLLINDVSTIHIQMEQASIDTFICGMYRGDSMPPECAAFQEKKFQRKSKKYF